MRASNNSFYNLFLDWRTIKNKDIGRYFNNIFFKTVKNYNSGNPIIPTNIN